MPPTTAWGVMGSLLWRPIMGTPDLGSLALPGSEAEFDIHYTY